MPRFAERAYNFSPGPAVLPLPVLEKVQKELLNYRECGASILEISHRSKDFLPILDETQQLFRQLTQLPDNYRLLFFSGGAQMQFSGGTTQPPQSLCQQSSKLCRNRKMGRVGS